VQARKNLHMDLFKQVNLKPFSKCDLICKIKDFGLQSSENFLQRTHLYYLSLYLLKSSIYLSSWIHHELIFSKRCSNLN